jgi:hypothetical protein
MARIEKQDESTPPIPPEAELSRTPSPVLNRTLESTSVPASPGINVKSTVEGRQRKKKQKQPEPEQDEVSVPEAELVQESESPLPVMRDAVSPISTGTYSFSCRSTGWPYGQRNLSGRKYGSWSAQDPRVRC